MLEQPPQQKKKSPSIRLLTNWKKKDHDTKRVLSEDAGTKNLKTRLRNLSKRSLWCHSAPIMSCSTASWQPQCWQWAWHWSSPSWWGGSRPPRQGTTQTFGTRSGGFLGGEIKDICLGLKWIHFITMHVGKRGQIEMVKFCTRIFH